MKNWMKFNRDTQVLLKAIDENEEEIKQIQKDEIYEFKENYLEIGQIISIDNQYGEIQKVIADSDTLNVKMVGSEQEITVSKGSVKSDISLQFIFHAKKMQFKMSILVNYMDSIQKILTKIADTINKSQTVSKIQYENIKILVKNKIYNYTDDDQVHQMNLQENDKMVVVWGTSGQEYSLTLYDIKKGSLSYSYYFRNQKKESLKFSVNKQILITSVTVFSLDQDHKSCYSYPIEQCELRIVKGKEFDQQILRKQIVKMDLGKDVAKLNLHKITLAEPVQIPPSQQHSLFFKYGGTVYCWYHPIEMKMKQNLGEVTFNFENNWGSYCHTFAEISYQAE